MILLIPDWEGLAAERISGPDRYQTAVEISKEGWKSADTIIIANGRDFPDALAGGPLAYQENAPILLTSKKSLNSFTKKEITRLKAKKVIILGGAGAISENVEAELSKMGLAIIRLGGKDRYETAALIGAKISSDRAVIASGLNFPDALAISPYAAKQGIPILLSRKDSLPSVTAKALNGKKNSIIAGGTGAISQKVAKELPKPVRYSGTTRYETAAKIINELIGQKYEAFVASGQDFPDALAGSVLAAKKDAPILLMQKGLVPEPIYGVMEDYLKYSAFGGTGALTPYIISELEFYERITNRKKDVIHSLDLFSTGAVENLYSVKEGTNSYPLELRAKTNGYTTEGTTNKEFETNTQKITFYEGENRDGLHVVQTTLGAPFSYKEGEDLKFPLYLGKTWENKNGSTTRVYEIMSIDEEDWPAYQNGIKVKSWLKDEPTAYSERIYAQGIGLAEENVYEGTALIKSITYIGTIVKEPAIHSISAIKAKWAIYQPTFSGNPFLEAPKVSAPYKPGKVHPGLIEDGLKMTNFVRYLTGIPENIVLDGQLNELNQYGSVLLARIGYLDHFPKKPADMDEEFYRLGYESTSTSNLNGGVKLTNSYVTPQSPGTMAWSVMSFMEDGGDNNVSRVGHRASILTPELQKIGFGFAISDSNIIFNTMNVIKGLNWKVKHNIPYTTWPAQGNFPVEFINERVNGGHHTPWSIHMERYVANRDEVKIELIRNADQKKWTFDKNDNDYNGEYFNVSGKTIVFKPDFEKVPVFKTGDSYTVRVTGIRYKQGSNEKGPKTSLEYEVNFFSLN